tara:strand:+ start:2013 stop:5024 length:3012 start_codon:yes stop_codon:yes gene_type:complete
MSVLNRSMFNKQIVNREVGSPPQGEKPSTTFFQKLFDGATGLGTGVGPYGDKEQGNILDLREYGAGVYDITDPQFVEFIKNYHQGDGTFEEGIQTYVNSLKTVERAEGSPMTGEQSGVASTLLKAIKNMSSSSINPRLRQMGSPPQGEMIEEQVDVENIGIMDGFNGGEEETAAAVLQEGERSKKEIDDADTYDELMRSVRGDDLSEAERRQELASVVGEKDAEETPDSVLALVQPVLQMLNEDTANTGIGQIEDGSMQMPERPVGVANGGYMSSFPNQNLNTQSLSASDNIDDRIMQNLQFERMAPGMMGYAEGGLVQQYASGGDVRRVPKYNTGTSSLGVTYDDTKINEDQGFGLDILNNEEETEVEPYDTTTMDFLTQILSPETGQSALKTKYDTNYKLFSEILGGQGPSKDEKIGEILTSVVSPLAFQYAQGADIQELLAAGTQAIGKISQKYSAQERKQESEIRSAALAQALKPAPDDPLVTVFLKDDPSTTDVDESLTSIQITTSQLKEDALRPVEEKLYTNNSTSLALQEFNKLKGETDKTNTEKALLDVELYYADEYANLGIKEQKELVKSIEIKNKIDAAIAANKPDELAAALKSVNLDNITKSITNETLRPKLEIELETLSVNLDKEIQNLKIKEIEANFTEAEKLLGLEEKQGIIDERLQTIDFNKNNNILLLEQKNAEIDNIILTGKNIELENEYKVLQNKFAEEEFSLENEALLLDNINKRLENTKLSIGNAYLPTEKKLGIDKLKLDMEMINENISGQMLQNEKTLLDLNNYDEKTFLEFQKQRREIEKLEYDLANPPKDWSGIKVQSEMRNKWNLSPMTVNMRDKQGFMENLVSNAAENTGAGDLSFIFQYMKMLDPRSVVREGEFETAKRTGGIPASVWAAYEGIKNGRLLSAQVKADFLSAASKMYMQEVSNYKAELGTYRDIATANGLDPELAIPSMNLNQKLIKQLTNVNKINDSLDIINNFDLKDSILPEKSDGKLKIPNLRN